MKTRVWMIKTNVETPGTYPPYYKRGDEGYIDGYHNDYAFVVLDNYNHIALIHFTALRIIKDIGEIK